MLCETITNNFEKIKKDIYNSLMSEGEKRYLEIEIIKSHKKGANNAIRQQN